MAHLEELSSEYMARLFPVIAETGKEQRATSILLSVLSAIPDFADALLSQVGQKISTRTTINTYTEVPFKNGDGIKIDRPDGIIEIQKGKMKWTALIEAKIGTNSLTIDQVERYLKVARENNYDALITISNQFAMCPSHHPLTVQKTLTRKVQLFHMSWVSILTEAMMMHDSNAIKDPEQKFLLRELIRFLGHDSVGVRGFTSMPPQWPDAIEKLKAGCGSLKKEEAQPIVDAWHQETRELSLIMSQKIGQPVTIKTPAAEKKDPELRQRNAIQALCNQGRLEIHLLVPDAASPISIQADMVSRALRISMMVNAPKDKKTTKARISWLLKQIKNIDSDTVTIMIYWASRSKTSLFNLAELRETPELAIKEGINADIRSFEIIMTGQTGRRFTGRKTFIEELEFLAPQYYELIGTNLKTWVPSPPKPIHSVVKKEEDADKRPTSKPLQAGNAHTDLLEIPSFLKRVGSVLTR